MHGTARAFVDCQQLD